jgi:hypothetical protein
MEIVAVVIAALLGTLLGWVVRLRETIRSSRQEIYLKWLATVERYRGEMLIHDVPEAQLEGQQGNEELVRLAREAITVETQLALVASEDTFNKAIAYKAASIGPSASELKQQLVAQELTAQDYLQAQWQLISNERRAVIDAMRKDLRLGVFAPRTAITR